MNAPFSPMNLPEAGPISPRRWGCPDPPPLRMSNPQIIHHVNSCLTGQRDTAFGEWKRYWERVVKDWDQEWIDQHTSIDVMNIDQASDRVRYIQQMMCIHARELFQSAPVELLEEEGLT